MNKPTLSLVQAYAVADMGAATHGYNVGVLSMLGLGEMARTHSARSREVRQWVDQLHALAREDEGFDFALQPTPEQRAMQARINEATVRQAQAWAPIQEIIEQAQAMVERAEAGLPIEPSA